MTKSKIAISIDNQLLKVVDSKIDNSVIRSRSQAIDYFLRRGLQEHSLNTAVILIKGIQQNLLLKEVNGIPLIKQQVDFFTKFGIKNVLIVTQHTTTINFLLNAIAISKIHVEIVDSRAKGNAEALKSIKEKIDGNFIVMSGDTFNNFDLNGMIKKHLQSDKLSTMGLMTREKPGSYGTAILDGDLIIDFQEKPKHFSTNIVNAGIYIFKHEIFEMLDSSISLEKDLFPKLAKLKQLAGFFTYGEYVHVG